MMKKMIHTLTLQDRGEKDHSLIDTRRLREKHDSQLTLQDHGEKHDSKIETRRS